MCVTMPHSVLLHSIICVLLCRSLFYYTPLYVLLHFNYILLHLDKWPKYSCTCSGRWWLWRYDNDSFPYSYCVIISFKLLYRANGLLCRKNSLHVHGACVPPQLYIIALQLCLKWLFSYLYIEFGGCVLLHCVNDCIQVWNIYARFRVIWRDFNADSWGMSYLIALLLITRFSHNSTAHIAIYFFHSLATTQKLSPLCTIDMECLNSIQILWSLLSTDFDKSVNILTRLDGIVNIFV